MSMSREGERWLGRFLVLPFKKTSKYSLWQNAATRSRFTNNILYTKNYVPVSISQTSVQRSPIPSKNRHRQKCITGRKTLYNNNTYLNHSHTVGRDGTGRDLTRRDRTGQDGTGREGARRDKTGRVGKGQHGTRRDRTGQYVVITRQHPMESAGQRTLHRTNIATRRGWK